MIAGATDYYIGHKRGRIEGGVFDELTTGGDKITEITVAEIKNRYRMNHYEKTSPQN